MQFIRPYLLSPREITSPKGGEGGIQTPGTLQYT
jgi:hypothetical protein